MKTRASLARVLGADELLHRHVCRHCGETRWCTTMCCRDPFYARPCWACEVRTAGRA